MWRDAGERLSWATGWAQVPVKSSGLGSSVLLLCFLFSSARPGGCGEQESGRMTSENLPIFSISTPRDYLGEGRGRKLVARRARPISRNPALSFTTTSGGSSGFQFQLVIVPRAQAPVLSPVGGSLSPQPNSP